MGQKSNMTQTVFRTLLMMMFLALNIYANTPPQITSTAVTSVNENSAYSYTMTGSDAEGDSLTWSVKSGTTLPSWLSLSPGSNYSITTVAGDGNATFADGNSTTASFNIPFGVAVDSSGNIFVADEMNNKIRKIDSSGNVTTVAGDGNATFADGNSTTASFKYPTGVALDGSGNIFVSDYGNNKIRKIDTSGNVTTVAGTGVMGFADGNSTTAKFGQPTGVALDGSGNIFVADYGSNKIRKIDSSGNVTTVAGDGTATFADGNSTTASFKDPYGVALDSSGNIFVSDTHNHRIRKIDINGNVTTVAGTGNATFADGNSTTASFNNPTGIAVDSSGNIFVADWLNNRIRKIDTSGNVTTIAGTGAPTFADGDSTIAKFHSPSSVAVDSSGNIFVADQTNHRIRKIAPRLNKLTGTPTQAGVYDVNLTLSDGVNTVEHNFQITVNHVNVAPALTLTDYQAWASVGSDYIDTMSVPGISSVIDSAGNIYVIYRNNSMNLSVKKYDGTSWSSVGVLNVPSSSDGYLAINQDTLYLAYQDVDSNNRANILKFDGTNWVAYGNQVIGVGQASNPQIKFDSNHIAYLSYIDTSDSEVWVKKYNGGTWDNVGDGNATRLDSTIWASGQSLAIDSNNVPYVVHYDMNSSDNSLIVAVSKFDGTNWVNVGSSLGNGETRGYAIAIDSSNVPYVVFEDNSSPKNIIVKKYNGSSWESVGSSIGYVSSNYPIIAIDNDVVYIAYVDSMSGEGHLKKFSGTDWVEVGKPFGKLGTNVRISMVFKNTVPIISFPNYKDFFHANNYPSAVTLEEPTSILIETPENNSSTIINLDATDDENNTLTFSISGEDASNFDINSSTGLIRFKTTPDYENPADANIDNRYNFTATVSDGIAQDSVDINITVTNVDETPPSGGTNVDETPPSDGAGGSTPPTPTHVLGNVEASSEIAGTTTQTDSTTNDVSTTLSTTNDANEDVVIDVVAKSSGKVKATHSVKVGTKETKAESELSNTKTTIKADKSVETTATLSENGSQVKVVAKPDGSASHEVKLSNNTTTQATSDIKGAQTYITQEGEVETSVEPESYTDANGCLVKAVILTDKEGESRSEFVKECNGAEAKQATVSQATPFEAGNTIRVYEDVEDANKLKLKIQAPVTKRLQF